MPKVRPIPKGYHTVTASLVVQGADAFIKFVKKAFGGKELMRMAGPGGSIVHAELQIGDSRIMICDESPQGMAKSAKSLGGTSLTFYIYVEKCDAVYKKALAAGATVRMPMTDMFWGDRWGMVEDPFGNFWGIATHIEDVTPKDIRKRAAKMFSQGAGAS